MTTDPRPLRFGHHMLAVVAAAMLGSTITTVLWTTALAFATGERNLGIPSLATLAAVFWLGVFVITLPATAVVLSLLFPVIRRQTVAANGICLGAGATMGLVLAPVMSPSFQGASLLHLIAFALVGTVVTGSYLVIRERLGQAVNET